MSADPNLLFNHFADLTRSQATSVREAHRVPPQVWLVWFNETCLGVYRVDTKALEASEDVRRRPEFQGQDWHMDTTARGWRWWCQVVDRVEVERRPVF